MIQAVLFDIDKVLIDIDHTRISHTLSFHSSLNSQEVHHKLFEGNTLKIFQCGGITEEEFFTRLKSELSLSEKLDEETFRRIYLSGFKYDNCIYSVIFHLHQKKILVGIIANIDTLTWNCFKKIELVKCLFPDNTHHFLSHNTGALKPGYSLFLDACDSFGLPREDILLVDSNEESRNVFENIGGKTIDYNAKQEWPVTLLEKLVRYKLLE